ncbi:MAG: hypothetical protein DHS20C16_34630 [Phycisphaerae bacterium]|nr:MAG: hypothetical protein DHS20C16_34630 [Phycisphaerae bacterium]
MSEGPYRMAVKGSGEPPSRLPFGRFGQEAKLSLVEVLSVIFRHKWKAVTVSGLVVAATLIGVSLMQDSYRSEAKIMMRDVIRTISLDPSSSDTVTGEYRPMKERATDELAILTSQELAENLVTTIGPLAVLPPNSKDTVLAVTIDGAHERTSDESEFHNLAVKTIKLGLESKIEGNVISLAYESSTPESAHAVLDGLVSNYQDRHREIMSASVSPEFFTEKAEVVLEQLTTAQNDLDALRAEYNLGDVTEQKLAAYKRQSDLEAMLSAIRVEIEATDAHVKSLEETLASRSRSVEVGRKTAVNEDKRALQAELRTLKFEETDLAMKFLDGDRPLKAVREKIAILEAELATQPSDDTEVMLELDATHQMLEESRAAKVAALQAARASETALAKQLVDAEQRVQFIERHEPTALRLQHEVARLRAEYEGLKDNESQTSMAIAMDRSKLANVSIIEKPTMPHEPVKSQKVRNLLLGLFMAVFAGIACAFVFEQLDDSMKTSVEAEKKLHLPVLATVAYDKAM